MMASAREDAAAYAGWQVQEKMRQRNTPHDGKCKRSCGSATSRVLASASEDAAAYHPACWQVQENIFFDRNAEKRTLLPPHPLYPPLQNTAGSGRKETATRNWVVFSISRRCENVQIIRGPECPCNLKQVGRLIKFLRFPTRFETAYCLTGILPVRSATVVT